jgi:hypothetical protein
MSKSALSSSELEKSLPRRLALGALLGWLIAFAVIGAGVYFSAPSVGWPMWVGVGAFAATFAGPYFGGGAALARHLLLVADAERRAGAH